MLRTFTGLAGLALVALPLAGGAQPVGVTGTGPFAHPRAALTYAPDRQVDLRHVAVRLVVDPAKRSISGVATNTVAPLQNGLKSVVLHCGQTLSVKKCTVGGQTATTSRSGDDLTITLPGAARAGVPFDIVISYVSVSSASGGGFGAGGGWHWITPTPDDPDHAGFWTQGEEMTNRKWVPMWDYPNDFATSEQIVTVPANWTVIGNGELLADTLNPGKKTRTVHWRMRQPHATYLMSLVGGPLSTKWSRWGDVKLVFAVPKGQAKLIDPSFSDTGDMLSFFSKVTGVTYPWPKYAQNAMYDFGGGMENVSATTLAAGSLNAGREGYNTMASLNAHELAHQWFGDLVTCRDWGHVWLNESFATLFDALYIEHSRGKAAYEREIEGDMQSYFGESRSYVRPLATRVYPSPSSMFDRHAYPKGAVVLHTLRRQLGDPAFFSALRLYLTRHRHQPVVTADLEKAVSDATGISAERFFDQWVHRPGHPVLSYSWDWDEGARQVVMVVKQTQDRSSGTPLYALSLTSGLILDGRLLRSIHTVKDAETTLRIDASRRPDAVLLDPDHDLLRELPDTPWRVTELPYIVRFAPNAVDRQAAASRLMSGVPSDDAVRVVTECVRADKRRFPVFTNIDPLVKLQRPELRAFWRELVDHPDPQRRATAVRALAALGKDVADLPLVRKLIKPSETDAVIGAATAALIDWGVAENEAALVAVARMSETRVATRASAAEALATLGTPSAIGALLQCAQPGEAKDLRAAALQACGKAKADEPRIRAALRTALKDADPLTVQRAVESAAARNERELLPDIRALQSKAPASGSALRKEFLADAIREAIAALEK